MTTAMLILLAIVAVTVVLFVIEPFPVDVTALLVLVVLVLLEPWTQISPREAVSGFSNPATITVLALLMMSEGVRRTGVIQSLGHWLSQKVDDSPTKQLGVTVAMSGPISAFMNNTPVVALLMPVVSEMAHKAKTSPSKLLIPLSYASMLGGMLTLIGTSTNILAADLSRRLLDEPITMFEFTRLGLVVFLVGALYLMVAAPKLLPERIKPDTGYLDEFGVTPYLTQVRVVAGAPMLGMSVGQWADRTATPFDVLALVREGTVFDHPYPDRTINEGDVFLLHAHSRQVEALNELEGVESVVAAELSHAQIMTRNRFDCLVGLVVAEGSHLEERTLADANFPERYDAYVLAVRRGDQTIQEPLESFELRAGDTILVHTSPEGIEHLHRSHHLVVLSDRCLERFRREKQPWMFAILAAVIGLAAAGVVSIMIAALGGVVAMVLTGVLRPREMYLGVEWRVVFLLAGIIPLGMALEQTGTAAYLGQMLAASAYLLPTIVVLWLFYIATGLITEVISNNASVLLMIPVAIETAEYIDANPFAFVLAVMFAASTAFLGPVGYQTNLFVYGAGGYRVSDFVRVGAPLQLILSVVTVCGIAVFWGL